MRISRAFLCAILMAFACLFVTANAFSEMVSVSATSPWSIQTTGTAQTDALISITASGNWTSGIWTGGPDGDTVSGPQGGSFIMPGVDPYSLIGKIGDMGTPFVVGSDYVGVANEGGSVFLGMNDVPGIFGDNHNALNANVQVFNTWHQINVSASQMWAATSYTLEVGDSFVIDAQGTWTSGSWTGGPEGDTASGPQGGSYIAPTEMPYGLIGRINGGTPFYIGQRYRSSADVSGVLELGMNDVPGVFGDNHGALTVTVGVPEPATLSLLALGGLALIRRRK